MSSETPIRCALCSADLEPCHTDHGVVWICRPCEAGATTLGVLRQVAPRPCINHLWQAARTLGLPSAKSCPSCTQPLLELDAPSVESSPSFLVCCHCFLVWLERPALRALRLTQPRVRSAVREAAALAEVGGLTEQARLARETRNTLLFAIAAVQEAAGVLESAFGEPAA
jgi:hypothetical protein